MSAFNAFGKFVERITALEALVRRQNVRINNMFREGIVEEVNYDDGTAIVNAHGVKSKPSSWLEQAGDINEWTPPSVGQRVVLVSPDGDLGKSFIMNGGFTDQVKQPHNQGAQKRVVIGGATITHSSEGLLVEVDGASYRFSADGLFIEVGGTTHKFTAGGSHQDGGKKMHDGKNVGSTHKHGGILRGGAQTDEPA